MGINSLCVYYVVRPQYVVRSDPVFSDMLKVNMSMFPLKLRLNVLHKPCEAGDDGLYYLCWRSSVFYWDKQQLYLDPPCSLEIKWMSLSFSVLFWLDVIYVAPSNHLQRCLSRHDRLRHPSQNAQLTMRSARLLSCQIQIYLRQTLLCNLLCCHSLFSNVHEVHEMHVFWHDATFHLSFLKLLSLPT